MIRVSFIPFAAALAVLVIAVSGLIPTHWVTLLNYIGISSLVSIGLVVLTGVGGMTSFGQSAFVGLAAYSCAVLALYYGLSPWLTLPVSLCITAIGALIVGLISVNLSGHYVPLSTLAWATAFFYLLGNVGWLGAYDGLSGIPPLRIGDRAIINVREYFIVVWIVLVLALIATRNLLRGRFGRAIRALRRGPGVAEAFGVSPAAAKLQVFVYCAILAALSGWLYAYFHRAVSPGPFGLTAGIEYLLMAVVGGSGYLFGGLLGAAAITLLRDRLQTITPLIFGDRVHIEPIVFGAILLLALQLAPSGLWPMLARWRVSHEKRSASGESRLPSRARPPKGQLLLDVKAVRKNYGGLVAVDAVSLQVKAAEIVGLIGPNGAGKTTLFNLITGVQTVSDGEIYFRGTPIHTIAAQKIASHGLARTFQHLHIMPETTVVENVALGAHVRGEAGILRSIFNLDRSEEARIFDEALIQLHRVGLGELAFERAGTLALGQLRLVEVARALCLDPILLLLDEPAAGLRVGEKKALANLLREIRADGVSILLVEHDVDFVMSVAERIVVVDFGAKIAEGLPLDIRENPKVIEAYLGGVL